MRELAAPSIECPRCHLTMPPQDSGRAFASCAGCGLSFDARYHEPAVPRRPPSVALAPGVRGTFKAPSMGYQRAPFPISGTGSCELGEHYLSVHGFRARGALARSGMQLAALVAAIAVGYGLATLGLADGISISAAFAVFVLGVLTALPASKQPARFRIPYESLEKVSLIGSRTVLILVTDFAPRGEIHFVTDDPDTLCRQLVTRIPRR